MKQVIFLWLVFVITDSYAMKPVFDQALFFKSKECMAGDPKLPTVLLVKQWHLAPGTNTKTSTPKTPYPQAESLIQIFKQLSAWIKDGTVKEIIAEGCEGEIDDKFKTVFQGWSYSDLAGISSQADFSKTLAHPVVMIEAKYAQKVASHCGDNLAEIKRSQLALSDARADVGYLTRLSEYKSKPDKLAPYLADVKKLYELKGEATVSEASKVIVADLKKSLDTFQSANHLRNISFVNAIEKTSSERPSVLVVGGLHVPDLINILEEKKMNCLVFEPKSYQNDEEVLTQKLNEAITRLE